MTTGKAFCTRNEFIRGGVSLAALGALPGFGQDEDPRLTAARRAFLVDMMGNAEETSVQGGLVALPLARRPCAVRLEGATFAEADETALRASPPAVRPTARIPRTDISTRMDHPDVVLREHGQVKEFYEANPAFQHRYWQGEKDLSARVWFDLGMDASIFRQPDSIA